MSIMVLLFYEHLASVQLEIYCLFAWAPLRLHCGLSQQLDLKQMLLPALSVPETIS